MFYFKYLFFFKKYLFFFKKYFLFLKKEIDLSQEKPPKTFLPSKKVSFNELTIRDIHPVEVARQLCLVDFQIFMKIRTSEFCEKNWQCYEKNEKSPNLLSFIEQFNRVRYF